MTMTGKKGYVQILTEITAEWLMLNLNLKCYKNIRILLK